MIAQIDVHDLPEEEVKFLLKIVEALREKTKLEASEKAAALNWAEALDATAGAWKDTIDCDKLKEDIYASRSLASTRPQVKFES